MPKRTDPKVDALRREGALNPRPDAVQDERFKRSEFFDPRDLVQVRYELVRRVHIDGATRCEAAFVAYGLEDEGRAASSQGLTPEFLTALRFSTLNTEVYEQAWGEQFGYVPNRDENDPGILNVQVNTQDDVTTILWHFQAVEGQ